MRADTRIYRTYVNASRHRVWEALTSPALTTRYFDFMEGFMAVQSDWQPGSVVRYSTPDGQMQIEGEILEIAPPEKLTTSISLRYEDVVRSEPPSRLTWEITRMEEACRLTVSHEPDGAAKTAQDVAVCMPSILSNLRVLLETGRPRLIKAIVVDCASPALLGSFWAAALGYVMQGPPPTTEDDFVGLADPLGIGPELGLQRVLEPKTVKNRLHLDLHVMDREAEVERLIALGARRAPGYSTKHWTVMLDPEDNEFCVMEG